MSRPKKKDHDAEAILMFTVLQAVNLFQSGKSLAEIAKEMKSDENKMNPLKVRKLLITGMVQGLCDYESEKAEAVLELYQAGSSIENIMEELLIDRRENSKSLSWSSVVLAFNCAMERTGQIITRPRELGDIRGISYIYPMLWRLGIISVPEKTAEKMEIQQNQAVSKRMPAHGG